LIKDPQQEVSLTDVRRTLRDRLPEYMVPSAFVFIERLPLTVNGKLDVKALPAPPAEVRTAHTPTNLKGSSLEESIADVWRAVLGLPSVGFTDNFFDVGGNSVHLANVHDQLQKRLGRTFSITDLFAFPTIGALATHFTGNARNDKAISDNQLRAQRQRDVLLAQRNMRRERK
jgi:acyl carrier protein